MVPMPSQEELDQLRVLHDKIKNHEFRKNPQKYLLDEYAELFDKDVLNILSEFASDGFDEHWCKKYKYYRGVRDRMLHYLDKHSPDGYFHFQDTAECWSNPNIAIYNYAMHDFRGIWWSLRSNWDNGFWHDHYFSRFIETTEILLILIHKLIDGELITKMKLPTERGSFENKYTEYELVQNPLYDNDWTLTKYLHKVWWEDKGYED